MLEKELKLAQKISEKLRKENEQAFVALGTEKEKVALLAKEKYDAVEEKKKVLQENAAILEAKKKVEEEKCKSDRELQFSLQGANKAEQQRLDFEAKVHQLQLELQVYLLLVD